MHGIGEATGAVTIVNALATGVGAAVGIALTARAEVDLHPAGSSGKWDVRMPDEARTPLVVAALTEALLRYAPGSAGSGELHLRSEVPVSRGLKSSSAVSSAVILAVARATETVVSPLEIARLSAVVSVSIGLSATGAFDDALAGLSSGVVVTDNRRRELLGAFPTEPGLRVALYVPPGTHRPSSEWSAAFAAETQPGKAAGDAALVGDWKRAMTLNTSIVERVLEYDYGPLRAALERKGAIASGVSGMGPALAAIAPEEQVPELLLAMPGSVHYRRAVSFSSSMGRDGEAVR